MMKVRILDRCEFCDGEAYTFVCEDVDADGDSFDRYRAGRSWASRPVHLACNSKRYNLLLAAVFGAIRLRVYL